jgi:hypothetical protein
MTELPAFLKEKTVFACDSEDIERFICGTYSLSQFEATIESHNDTNHLYDIKKRPLDDHAQGKLREFLERKWCEDYNLRIILTDLCNKDLLPEGEYLVRVSW